MNSLDVKRVSQQGSLSQQVSRQLEAIISRGEIAVGDKLPPENGLCEMFGVSRTVIREAITHLKSLGLVETRRGIGTRVLRAAPEEAYPAKRISLTTVEDILSILELRLTLEPEAAALAAARRDDEDLERLRQAHARFIEAFQQQSQAREEDFAFHFAVAQATHNPAFTTVYEQLNLGAIPRAKLLSVELDTAATHRYLERVAQEHADILEAIMAGDEEAAREAMRHHLSRASATYASYRS
ncbi:FadR/GntR family transcriptional regulator [Chromohalobacter israelensis]|uniref:Transcriptional regulator, GntR family n=1 Tax=Chromohalobacter israelensis (strain ATCC BAA-138 / DSM 3043 / CIP 106854 / NCIMB 13768 / 1H11) TaxID=290398 RepID=Q1QUN8_CHRI1|nr:FadR/GntR family transcriptional regulator [Chromohalobacter salexigens]ABE59820.1 transcriptional regulator, GntR family [Chromohalobacter salexigens DSM 3043]